MADVPEAPKGETVQEFCSPGEYTLATLEIEGTNIQWHTSPLGEDILPEETVLQNGMTYYATQSNGTCLSDERLAVEVFVYAQVSGNTISGEQYLYQLEKPEEIIGTEPQGGTGNFTYTWEQKTADSEWEIIEGAKRKDYSPKPLLETTSFRRTASDEICGDYLSNELSIEVSVAPIIANDDNYGPLINYEAHILPSILLNDSLKNKPVLPEDIKINILSIQDQEGNNVELDSRYSMDSEGISSLPEDIAPGIYIVRYSICQKTYRKIVVKPILP